MRIEFDDQHGDGETATSFTIREIIWDADAADAEVARLNAESGSESCHYLWELVPVRPLS